MKYIFFYQKIIGHVTSELVSLSTATALPLLSMSELHIWIYIEQKLRIIKKMSKSENYIYKKKKVMEELQSKW